MFAFLIASSLLLFSPGPTNTLMALAGAQGGEQCGILRVRTLLLAAIAGYVSAILPLLVFGDLVEHRWPSAALALKLAMAAWVLFLAARLWTSSQAEGAAKTVTAAKVYATTLLNPKGLVIALVLLPAGGRGELPLRLALLMVLITGAGLAWGSGGWALCLRDGSGRRRLLVQRAASVWLALLSVMLVAQVAPA